MTTLTDSSPPAPNVSSPPATYEAVRELYLGPIFAFVSRRVKPREEAEDVTAKVFADAYESWGRLRGEPRLWLFGIARRRVADSLRRRRWWALKETDASTDGMSEFMHSEEVRMAVSITMRLPEAERDAFLLQALEGFSIAEIATIIGRSPKATNSLLQRAKARIRRMVDREERFK